MPKLSVVIPVFNEADNLPRLYQRFKALLPQLRKEISAETKEDIEILFVNDGSLDNSIALLESFVASEPAVYRYISLSRNFGHQAAVSAGIYHARGSAVVIMDADLQDPPELILDMVKKWEEGFDVVYAVRQKRESPFFNNIAYKFYYWFKCLIADYPVQKDSGDFSLLDRKIVEVINKFPEKERYVRGLRAWVGFKQVALPYKRVEREAGKSKYSFFALAKLALSGILSTSVKPLFISGLFSFISILMIIGVIAYSVFSKFYIPQDQMPKGWTSLIITVAVFSGLQLISIWLLSLYMARMYREMLSRPTYLIAHDSLEKGREGK